MSPNILKTRNWMQKLWTPREASCSGHYSGTRTSKKHLGDRPADSIGGTTFLKCITSAPTTLIITTVGFIIIEKESGRNKFGFSRTC